MPVLNNRLYLTCLWPGLPELWWRGRLTALPTAIFFGVSVNFLLIARFLYPEWLLLSAVKAGCWLGMAAWLYGVIRNIRALPGLIYPRKNSGKPDRFVEAHQAYLRSDWALAETLLMDCLSIEERDPPALLLLTAAYRHCGKLEAARSCIQTLRLTEAADRWWLEVDAEEKRLIRDQAYRDEASGASATDVRKVSNHKNASHLGSPGTNAPDGRTAIAA